MEVHEVIDDSALEVVFDLVDDDLSTDVDQLDVCKILLILVDGLVHLLVFLDPVAEVSTCDFRVLALVVWGCGLYFHDIRHDDVVIVAFRLDVQCLDTICFAALGDPSATSLG